MRWDGKMSQGLGAHHTIELQEHIVNKVLEYCWGSLGLVLLGTWQRGLGCSECCPNSANNRIWPSMKRGYLVRSDVNSGRGASVDHGKNRLIHGRYEKLANKEKRDTENRGSRTSTGARKFKSWILYRMRRAFEPPNSLIWPPH